MFDSLSFRVVASGGSVVPGPPFKTMKMVV